MNEQSKAALKLLAVSLCVIAGGGFFFSRVRDASRVGEEGAQVWFYDQSEKELYPAPRDTIAPHKGVGGAKNDGVRAVVTAPKGDGRSARQRRIAYLETYTPALKQLLEEVRAARAAHRALPVAVPARDSDYFGTNTLVRRVSEPAWHPASSPEGQQIRAEWRTWQGTGGQPLVLCLPE